MIIPLDRLLPAGSCDLTRKHWTGRPLKGCRTPIPAKIDSAYVPFFVPLFGLAPDGVYLAFDVTIEAVSSYLAVSPLPVQKNRRFIFCGTFLRVAPSRR